MISLASISTPPEAPRNEAENFLNLIATLADPKATKQRVAELVQAATAARQETDALNAAKAALADAKAARAAHDAELAAERTAHVDALAAERKSWQQERAKSEAEILRRNQESASLFLKAKDDAAKAEQVRLNLEARLARIRDAAA
jgi:hypothetical protein